MKYGPQLSEAVKVLPGAANVIVVLPNDSVIDKLAAGLALYLALDQKGKESSIVSEGIVRVGHTNLFGVGQIRNNFPELRGGNFVVTLGGVVDQATQKPNTLEKLDWYPQSADLKLVFHTLPGQKFEPTFVNSSFEGGGVDLVFVIGAATLDSLGSLYINNRELFGKAHIINIDNHPNNTQFGTTNIVDAASSSICQMMAEIIPNLGLNFEGDIATNLLAGIFESTSNLSQKADADTFEAVAKALRANGQRPVALSQPSQPQPQPTQPLNIPQELDINKIMSANSAAQQENFVVPPTVSQTSESEPQPSPEEVPCGETAETVTPEDDWLTPKIFKGTSLS